MSAIVKEGHSNSVWALCVHFLHSGVIHSESVGRGGLENKEPASPAATGPKCHSGSAPFSLYRENNISCIPVSDSSCRDSR